MQLSQAEAERLAREARRSEQQLAHQLPPPEPSQGDVQVCLLLSSLSVTVWFCGWHIMWCSASKSFAILASVPERALQSCTKCAAVVDMAFSMVLRPPCVLPPPCPHLRQLQSSRSAALTATGQAVAAVNVGQARAMQQQQGACKLTTQQSAHRQRGQRSLICATVMTTKRWQIRRCSPQECNRPAV